MRRTIGLAIAAVAAVVAIAAAPASATTRKVTAGVVPPWARPGGRTYGQWSGAQWRWEIQQPNDPTSPVVDPNPGTASQPEAVDCAIDQSGHVWFLSGTSFLQGYSTAYRSCTIPRGVSLFFPVVDAWLDNLSCPGDPPGTLTAEEIQSQLAEQTDSIVPGSMSVTVDGAPVAGLEDASTAYRATAHFTYSLSADSPLGPFFCGEPWPAGTSPPPPGAYADGVYVMLAPLSPGRHHIAFTAQESGGLFGKVTQNVEYTITVS